MFDAIRPVERRQQTQTRLVPLLINRPPRQPRHPKRPGGALYFSYPLKWTAINE